VLTGSFWILYLYDVSEEIRLDSLRASPPARNPAFRHHAPDYVRFQKPPLIEPLDPVDIGGEKLHGQIAFYDYGVVSVELERPFRFDWPELVQFSSRWIGAPEVEDRVNALVAAQIDRVKPALVKPFDRLLTEDYYIVRVDPSPGVPASQFVDEHGGGIAQIVRGESVPLSGEECAEVLQGRMSYYPADVAVVGYTCAFLYDTPDGAAPAIQLLEYANTQLLEFRHYDDVLTRRLAEVYQTLEKGTGWFRRWRLAREAGKLNAIRLDIRELTERTDTAIKFLSDMFSARLYKLAAARVGVPDYRRLVEEKLRAAGELYQFMNERFHQSSALVLELMVVVILVIELVYLFKGKT
jgi:hypothetical protein